MTDRERILTSIIQLILIKRNEISHPWSSGKSKKTIGSIVVAHTTFKPNPFVVGYYMGYDEEKDCAIIKDLVSEKLCDYYNENFYELPIEWFGKYELLYGKKYKIYKIVGKAKSYKYRFAGLEFNDEDKTFTVSTRITFTNKVVDKITLSQDLSLKEIKKKFDNWEIKEVLE